MNTQQISCFLEAARYKSFTKAAKHLYVSQASFSRNIAQLEKELGLVLFVRSSFQGIELTESGTIMQEAFLSARSEIRSAMDKAHRLEHTKSLQLAIGLLEGQLIDDSLESSLARFRLEYPNASVHIRRDTYYQLIDALKTGEVDLVCMPTWQLTDDPSLAIVPHANIETILVAPKRLAPEAEDKTYSITDFSSLPFVSIQVQGGCPSHEMLEQLFAAAGITPPIVQARNIREQIQKVEMGEGAVLINPYNYICYSPNITRFHVRELVPQPFSFAWKKDQTPEVVSLFRPFLLAADKS